MAGEQFKGNPEKQIRDYNAGDFQNTDPVTGEARNEPLPDNSTQPIEQIQNPNDPNARAAGAAADEDFDGWTKDDLQAESEKRGLTVKGTGEGNRVLKEDYVKALRKANRA